MNDSTDFTQVLNAWVMNHDVSSANQLKSMVYFHLKGMVKKQIAVSSAGQPSKSFIDQLPNTTSLLHEILIKLPMPDEIYESRGQFFVSLALFVRWMLQDEIKKRSAKKRTPQQEQSVTLLNRDVDPSAYLDFDNVLSHLEKQSKRCYEVALLHFFLGLTVDDIKHRLDLSKSTVYNEISSAKAYLRVHCSSH